MGVRIVHDVSGTASTSPFIIDVIETTASLARKLIGLFKNVRFAERAKVGNRLQWLV